MSGTVVNDWKATPPKDVGGGGATGVDDAPAPFGFNPDLPVSRSLGNDPVPPDDDVEGDDTGSAGGAAVLNSYTMHMVTLAANGVLHTRASAHTPHGL